MYEDLPLSGSKLIRRRVPVERRPITIPLYSLLLKRNRTASLTETPCRMRRLSLDGYAGYI